MKNVCVCVSNACSDGCARVIAVKPKPSDEINGPRRLCVHRRRLQRMARNVHYTYKSIETALCRLDSCGPIERIPSEIFGAKTSEEIETFRFTLIADTYPHCDRSTANGAEFRKFRRFRYALQTFSDLWTSARVKIYHVRDEKKKTKKNKSKRTKRVKSRRSDCREHGDCSLVRGLGVDGPDGSANCSRNGLETFYLFARTRGTRNKRSATLHDESRTKALYVLRRTVRVSRRQNTRERRREKPVCLFTIYAGILWCAKPTDMNTIVSLLRAVALLEVID